MQTWISGGGSSSGTGGSAGTEPEKFTVAWYLPNGNPIVWYELAPGEVIPEAPQCPEGVIPKRPLDLSSTSSVAFWLCLASFPSLLGHDGTPSLPPRAEKPAVA